ncbi:MAG TPA: serine hydrolase domain-containing protein [Candidatus Eisenbacteria bacterium]|nr:serine hydrolase domain-containing protein [Candidatus Eisenbacteria bacterium]
MDFHSVEQAFEEAVAEGVFPGAVVLIGREGEVVYERAFGWRSLAPAKTVMRPEVIFDLASLTKPLATATAIMVLVRDGKIRIDDRVTRFLPTFGVFGKSPVTIRHLLTHTSGLAAWRPFYQEIAKPAKAESIGSPRAKNHILSRVHREKLVNAPGTRTVYSDLGFMVLGEIVELVGGCALDRFCDDHIFKPLGLRSTSFFELSKLRARTMDSGGDLIAPTEDCPWRKKILYGEVHDDNAYAMGGVAGHAGLFSSAADIHRLLGCLDRCRNGKDDFLPRGLVEQFLSKDMTVPDSTWALGWDTPSPENSSAGSRFSPRSVGHLGFTGPSVWWDIEKSCHVILLNNRVHPTRRNEKIKAFRPRIHDLIMEAVKP